MDVYYISQNMYVYTGCLIKLTIRYIYLTNKNNNNNNTPTPPPPH